MSDTRTVFSQALEQASIQEELALRAKIGLHYPNFYNPENDRWIIKYTNNQSIQSSLVIGETSPGDDLDNEIANIREELIQLQRSFSPSSTVLETVTSDSSDDDENSELKLTLKAPPTPIQFEINYQPNIDDATDDFIFSQLPLTDIVIHSPRALFLKQKLHALSKLKTNNADNNTTPIEFHQNDTPKSALSKIRDTFQYVVNMSDDVTNAVGRGFLSPDQIARLLPYVIGAVGVIVNFIEICKGFKGAWKAISSKDTEENKVHIRKTRIVANSLITATSATGIGLSLSYILGATGLAVNGFVLMPMLIPLMNVVRVLISITKESYSNFKLRQKVNRADRDLNDIKNSIQALNQKLNEAKQRRSSLIKENENIYTALTSDSQADPASKMEDIEKYNLNDKEIADASEIIFTSTQNLSIAHNRLTLAKAEYNACKEELLANERELSSKWVELFASGFIVPGIVLGTASLLTYFKVGAITAGVVAGTAGSVASFGALPIALISIGAAIAVGTLIFHAIDSWGYNLDYKTDDNSPPKKDTFHVRMNDNGLEYTVMGKDNTIITQTIPKEYLITQVMGERRYQQLLNNFDIELLKPFMEKIIQYAETVPQNVEDRIQPSWGTRRLKNKASNGMRKFFADIFSPAPKMPEPKKRDSKIVYTDEVYVDDLKGDLLRARKASKPAVKKPGIKVTEIRLPQGNETEVTGTKYRYYGNGAYSQSTLFQSKAKPPRHAISTQTSSPQRVVSI